MDQTWELVLASIAAIGAFGTAAFGIAESLGKAICYRGYGLPYRGFGAVKELLRRVAPALRAAYGDSYELIVRQEYRNGRAGGRAPEIVRQGVRLGIPFLNEAEAKKVMQNVWGLSDADATSLAVALSSDEAADYSAPDTSAREAALASRFALALDTRIDAAFSMAEQSYRIGMKTAAAFVALGLALGFKCALGGGVATQDLDREVGWALAWFIGIAAVPLAPVAKDLTTGLNEALTAWRQIGRRPPA
tara:strand:+ start:1077 stop:1820 length:744 start_codon:yes stop_codon:yes gene_type:complete